MVEREKRGRWVKGEREREEREWLVGGREKRLGVVEREEIGGWLREKRLGGG